jgi:hypothetical protein
MARPPNYSFERQERERLKARKLADKAAAKQEQRDRERAQAEAQAGGDHSAPADDE